MDSLLFNNLIKLVKCAGHANAVNISGLFHATGLIHYWKFDFKSF